MKERRAFLTQEDVEKISASIATVDEIARTLDVEAAPASPQGTVPEPRRTTRRDHLNWQLVQFVCDEPRASDGYFHGKVMLGEGKELGDCHLRSGIKAIDLNAYYSAVMVETVTDDQGRVTPVFFVPASDGVMRFKLLEDLFKCSSARALPVFYKNGSWCNTDTRCPPEEEAYYSGGDADQGEESGSGGAASGQEITVHDSIGIRMTSKSRRDGSGRVPGLLGEKGDVGFATWKGDSGKWEVQAVGDACCPIDSDQSGSGSGGSGYDSGCCEIEVLTDVDVTCVDGNLSVTKTYSTYEVACCE